MMPSKTKKSEWIKISSAKVTRPECSSFHVVSHTALFLLDKITLRHDSFNVSHFTHFCNVSLGYCPTLPRLRAQVTSK